MSPQDKAIIVKPQFQPQKVGNAYPNRADIVIIGSGIAGLTAALEARRLAPEKRIVMLTEQTHPTINTPALKQFAIGKLTQGQMLAYPAGTERAERIHVMKAYVEKIHARSKYVSVRGGSDFGYDSLLIATGSEPMGLPKNVPGRDFDGVLTLHRLTQYLDLRRRVREVREVVVVGGGVHAVETVMGLLYWGIRVHWLIRGTTFMPRQLDQTASQMVLDHLRRKGVIIHTETEIVGILGTIGVVVGIITNQQEMIPCQLVVCCTGTQPISTLADYCDTPILHKHGILVDDKLCTSIPSIYAAGDVAALKNPQTGKFEPRAQWYSAVLQGRIAGAMLTGHEELAHQPFGAFWHATHLGELSMLTVGNPLQEGHEMTTLTDVSRGGYRRIAISDDRLVGYLSLGHTQPDSLAIKRIIDEGYSIRAITKDLLKGNIDVRRYLAQQHPQVVQSMTTRKLSSLKQTEPLVTQHLPARRQTEPLQSPQSVVISEVSEQSLQHTLLSLPSASAKSERGLWAYAGEASPRREYNDQAQWI